MVYEIAGPSQQGLILFTDEDFKLSASNCIQEYISVILREGISIDLNILDNTTLKVCTIDINFGQINTSKIKNFYEPSPINFEKDTNEYFSDYVTGLKAIHLFADRRPQGLFGKALNNFSPSMNTIKSMTFAAFALAKHVSDRIHVTIVLQGVHIFCGGYGPPTRENKFTCHRIVFRVTKKHASGGDDSNLRRHHDVLFQSGFSKSAKYIRDYFETHE